MLCVWRKLDGINDFGERNVLGMLGVNVTLGICQTIGSEHKPPLVPRLAFRATLHQVATNNNMIRIEGWRRLYDSRGTGSGLVRFVQAALHAWGVRSYKWIIFV